MFKMGCCYQGLFPDEVIRLVASIVKGFQNKYSCLKQVGLDDLMQECVLHLWIKTGGDLEKCNNLNAFVRRITGNKLLDMAKGMNADKRKIINEAISLDEERFINDKKASLHEVLSSVNIAYPFREKTEFMQLIWAVDLENLIQLFDQRKRTIIINILRGYNLSEISRIISMPRSSIYEEFKLIRVFLN